jgi:transcriptional regulator with XRE-family HTH domain
MTTATATDLTSVDRLGRRVAAVRALGGFVYRADLAVAIDGALSAESIKDIESGRRLRTSPAELDVIATACGVPVEFFAFDIDSLTQASVVERLEAVEGKLAAVLVELRRDGERVG